MRMMLQAMLICAPLALGFARPAHAQAGDVAHSVSYLEVVPRATQQAVDLLAAYAEAARDEDGNLRFQALQRIGRPNHFAILQTWMNQGAYESHMTSVSSERSRESLAPLLIGPPDEREHWDLVADASGDAPPDAIYVLTHIDVFPANIELTVEHLRTLAAASRREQANVRFDVLVSERKNHMTVVEVWRSAAGLESHLSEPHTQTFRTNMAPLHGALYDERLYRAIGRPSR